MGDWTCAAEGAAILAMQPAGLLSPLAALAFALALAAPGSASANIFETDDRVAVERLPGTPWAAVGLITQTTPGRDFRFGTVTLVGPCHALTAHHTAFRSIAQANSDEPSHLWFGPPRPAGAISGASGDAATAAEGGAAEGGSFPWTWRVTARPVAWGDLDAHVHGDWALLELEHCLGAELGWWELAPLGFDEIKALEPNALRLVGHPTESPRETALLDPACNLYRELGSVPGWRMDCAVRVGNSGGPVFLDPTEPAAVATPSSTAVSAGTAKSGPLGPRLIAIVKGDFFPQPGGVIIPQWDERAANVALPVYAFIETLRPHLAAGQARAAREAGQ
ncbi:trypsin-like serine peptidase [Algihabitans albus]|uniref:trypsin-like serine peptidase n=1 Tax=Algihabitans albus TaxID=2164067 RepID=UPI000E5C8D2F|nr:trypsin-like peptidase domain-containing protein [Algihabitans albus]